MSNIDQTRVLSGTDTRVTHDLQTVWGQNSCPVSIERIRPGGDGYYVLTCTDCLRLFQATSTPENKMVERSAVCVYCGARVPFLIEGSHPA